MKKTLKKKIAIDKKNNKKELKKEIKTEKKISNVKISTHKKKTSNIPKKLKVNSSKKDKSQINKDKIKKKEPDMPEKKVEKKEIRKPTENKEKAITKIKKVQETIAKKEPEIFIKASNNIHSKEHAPKTMMVNQNTPYFTILFVCTGNMCRSPLAEGIMKRKIEEEFSGDEKDFIMIHSCGTYAYEGNKPSENALKTAKHNNTDISYIRSKPLAKLIVDEADIIFAMSVEHMNYIIDNFLSAKNKTFLLKQFGENRLTQMSDSIPDPMGFTIEYYTKTYQEIKNAIDKVFPLIKENIQKKLQNKIEKTN